MARCPHRRFFAHPRRPVRGVWPPSIRSPDGQRPLSDRLPPGCTVRLSAPGQRGGCERTGPRTALV